MLACQCGTVCSPESLKACSQTLTGLQPQQSPCPQTDLLKCYLCPSKPGGGKVPTVLSALLVLRLQIRVPLQEGLVLSFSMTLVLELTSCHVVYFHRLLFSLLYIFFLGSPFPSLKTQSHSGLGESHHVALAGFYLW